MKPEYKTGSWVLSSSRVTCNISASLLNLDRGINGKGEKKNQAAKMSGKFSREEGDGCGQWMVGS